MELARSSLLIGIRGFQLSSQERRLLATPGIGGVVLFSRNFQDVEQLTELNAEIRSATSHHLLICIDQEGGPVQRLQRGYTRLPELAAIGRLHDRHPERALVMARDHGWLMAMEVLGSGIDLSFAPVLDLGRGNRAIGSRAFHAETGVVVALGRAYISGMRDAGMASVGKHFPGHGSVLEDSHVAAPVDSRSRCRVLECDGQVFAALSAQGLDAVMAAHVTYPAFCSKPAGFSRTWLKQVLRVEMGFSGEVFSDDLGMEAAASVGDISQRVHAALHAGCDYALVCDPEQAEEAAASLQFDTSMPAPDHSLAGRPQAGLADLSNLPDYQRVRESLRRLGEE